MRISIKDYAEIVAAHLFEWDDLVEAVKTDNSKSFDETSFLFQGDSFKFNVFIEHDYASMILIL